jgi:subtilisin family serine protease
MKVITVFFLILILFVIQEVAAQAPSWQSIPQLTPRISPRLMAFLSRQAPDNALKFWIFFTDKGITSEAAYQIALIEAERRLTERARRRLRRVNTQVDIHDLPLYQPYIQQIVSAGGRVVGHSRWLNAVSVSATPEILYRLAELPFVRTIEPVSVYRRPIPPAPKPDLQTRILKPPSTTGLSYGPSATQLAQLHVPELHDLGLSGRGVLVAVFDTGFNLNHTAFDSLRSHVVAEWDFIHGDDNTADDPQQDIFVGQHNHGTETLSAIAGYAPGALIGPAYGAQFLLAKTESIAFEQQIEEDWWLQAMEWADSLGADIISSSLGYNVWYQISDMDGKTAVTTKAATVAVSRGIVVVNAMGNEGQSLWRRMIAPADADGIISVGAVDSLGARGAFSSIGPTFDGRIKPDVMAMGVDVRVVNPNSADTYFRLNGTSFATPLVAGVTALLLEAYPHWTPAQILAALQQTASQADAPDSFKGYGVANALDALLTESSSQVTAFTAVSDINGVFLRWTTALEVNIQAWILTRKTSPNGSFESLLSSPIPARSGQINGGAQTYFYLDTTAVPGLTYEYALASISDNNLPLVVQPLSSNVTFIPTGTTNIPPVSLHQNAPNPFNPNTKITFDLTRDAHVILIIYNILGQEVRVLINEQRGAGSHSESWDGTDAGGRVLSSGVYFYKLTAGTFQDIKKMLLLR